MYYFLISKLKQKKNYLFTLDKRDKKLIFIGIVYWASSSRLSSFVHLVVGDAKLDAQEKLFVLMTLRLLIKTHHNTKLELL